MSVFSSAIAAVKVCLMSRAKFCRSLCRSKRLGLGAVGPTVVRSAALLGESRDEACPAGAEHLRDVVVELCPGLLYGVGS